MKLKLNIKKFKLFVNVPITHADMVRGALSKAGAGIIGNYIGCSFSVKGVGRFTPGDAAKPYVGEINKSEMVEEVQDGYNISYNNKKYWLPKNTHCLF